ncbi:MAG: ABC transporter transmembrane domain-containing protein [Persephonella sp.]|nr:ABC transporter transmembrane domain-containing protein [Persephonella sp.]
MIEKESLTFLYRTYKKYWPLLLLALSGSILESASMAGLAYMIKDVVDDVFVEKSYEKLIVITSILIGIAVSKQIGFFLKNYIYPAVIYRALSELRGKIYNRILRAKPSVFRKQSSGDIISRATTDVERFGEISSTIGNKHNNRDLHSYRYCRSPCIQRLEDVYDFCFYCACSCICSPIFWGKKEKVF